MDKDLTLVESFIRKATDMKDMADAKLIEDCGEVARVLRHVPPLTSNEVAENIVRLHRQHAREVTGVMDKAISDHASDIRESRLPPKCAIILALPETYRVEAAGAGTGKPTPECRGHVGLPHKPATHDGERRGRKADAETNRTVAQVVEAFGSSWRGRLIEICGALDEQELPLPRSRKWKGKGCSDWADVLCEDKEGLVKALQHRLDWVLQHHDDISTIPPASQSGAISRD
jgi:hypothetical protein